MKGMKILAILAVIGLVLGVSLANFVKGSVEPEVLNIYNVGQQK